MRVRRDSLSGATLTCPGEEVIVKQDASVFTAPALAAAIERLGLDWLIVGGCWSEACVAATVKDGVERGVHMLLVKDACGADFLTVTPGIRFADAATDDQARVMTPEKARLGGSDYIVVGRPITAATDPLAAYRRCVAEFLG